MIYEYQCPACKKVYEIERPMAKRDEPHLCQHCEQYCVRFMISSKWFVGKSEYGRIPGVCRTLKVDEKGKPVPIYVKSKQHWREICKREGVYPAGL